MKQRIRIWLRNFFGFSRTETNGFIILIILMVVILSMPFISRKIYSSYEKPLQSTKDKIHLNSLLSTLKDNIESKSEAIKEKKYQTFDLNKSTAQQLSESGFPEFLAERIIKYREKVKPFESKEDLLNIYGIDSAFYQEIQPYITISKLKKDPVVESKKVSTAKHQIDNQEKPPKELKKTKFVRFDLNKADSTQLQKIYGIGPAYSKRIIKYRDYLGGFHSLNQLNEVYGLKEENLDSLKNHVYIEDQLTLKKLKVNQLDADSLVQHPYISYKEANLIVNYRKQHGEFKSVPDLLSIKVLDSSWVKKVSPYITFD